MLYSITFYNYWKYDVKLDVLPNEGKSCRWCGKSIRYGHCDSHECHECFLRISLDCEDKIFCKKGCDGKYCYKCFMENTYGLDCSCKGCNCVLPDPDDICYECRTGNNRNNNTHDDYVDPFSSDNNTHDDYDSD